MLTCIVYFQFHFCKEFIAVLMVVGLIWRFVEENYGSIGILSFFHLLGILRGQKQSCSWKEEEKRGYFSCISFKFN